MKTILLSMLAQACLLLGQTNPSQVQNTSHPGIEYPEGSHPQGKMIGQRSDSQFPHAQRPESDSVLTLLGRWPWGPCYAVAVRDNYGFIGNGALVQALDLTDPSHPTIVGEYLTGQIVSDICVRDSLAFVCTRESLLILDASSPSRLLKLGGVGLPGVEKVRVTDSLALVTLGDALAAIDISDVRAPFLRGFRLAASMVQAFAVSGRYVYLGDLGRIPGEMVILDVTNPDSIAIIGSFNAIHFPYAAAIKDTLLLISGDGAGEPDAVKVYSIANPSVPVFLSGVPGINGRGISIRDTVAYVAAVDGFSSISIAQPSQPIVLDSLALASETVALSQTYAVVSDGSRAYIVNSSRPDSLSVAGIFPTGDWAMKIALKDTLAFIASKYVGLWIINIADPASPRSVANLTVGGFAVDVVAEGNYAYLVNYPGDLWIIDVSDPNMPRTVSHSNTTSRGGPSAIAKSGNLIFVTQLVWTNQDTVVRIMDVNDPTQPRLAGAITKPMTAYDVAARDSILFVASPDSGLQIFDVRDPQSPQTLGKLNVSIASVALRDSTAVAAFGQLYIVSIADLSSPYVLGSILAGFGVTNPDVTISGNFAYWTNGDGAVFDISNPGVPRQIVRFMGNDVGRGVTVKDNLVFYADQTGGVWIWRNDLITSVELPNDNAQPSNYQLFQNYPNPFNPSTTIEYSIPTRGRMALRIYNVLGQEVTTLVDREENLGQHAVMWNGDGVASGIYFCRLETQDHVLTIKLLLLK